MKNNRVFFKIILFLVLTIPVYAADTWTRAVDTYSRFDGLKPYSMTIYSETFDGRGNLEKIEEQFFDLDYSNGPDEPESRLISAFEDGKDVTDKKRKELEKGDRRGGPPGGEDMEGMDRHPLDPAIQYDVMQTYSGRREYKNGRSCEIWDFEMKLNKKYTAVGTAWLDPATGSAVSLSYRIEPLFPFVEEMKIAMDFETDAEQRWFLSSMNMAGRVNMIIMKRTFDSVMEFSDYR